MGRPRINPPAKAVEIIKRLASEGYEPLGIAEEFGVHIETFNEWLDSEPKLQYAYEVGREIERQALHRIVFEAAKANRAANGNAKFLLIAKHGYKEDKSTNAVNVAVDARSVLLVKDHGTDEEWAAKAAAQQAALIGGEESAKQFNNEDMSSGPRKLDEEASCVHFSPETSTVFSSPPQVLPLALEWIPKA